MGKDVAGINDSTIREVVSENGNGNGRNDSTSPRTSDTTTENGGSGGDHTTRTATAGEKTVPVQESDGLSVLSEDEKKAYLTADEKERKRLLRNAKKRERYAQTKKANGETVKPRKVNKPKNAPQVLDSTQLNLIFMAISSAVASRPNCEHWLLSEQEINSITEPLAKMLAESETFANVGQYSNQIALVMACLTVFGPRIFVTVQKSKEVKRVERTGQQTDTTVRDGKITTTGKTKNGNRADRRTDVVGNQKSDDKHDGDNVPFLGFALA